MKAKVEISATIVLYKNDIATLHKVIDCFLNIPLTKKLFLIDNSPSNKLQKEVVFPEIEYVFIGKNLGFGKAHNYVVDKISSLSDFHLVLNPDVIFNPNDISKLTIELNKNSGTGIISPKVVYPNGEVQYICRKHPRLKELFFRRLGIFKSFTRKQEYRDQDLSKPFNPDFVHGCFMLFKTQEFVKVNGFDKRYFMYLEDADICRKLAQNQQKVLYYPEVIIEHKHQKGSAKKINLLLHHLSSAIKYHKKWKN